MLKRKEIVNNNIKQNQENCFYSVNSSAKELNSETLPQL